MRHAFRGSVSTVGRAECVVHEQRGIAQQGLGELRIVLLFTRIKTDIFQQNHITVLHGGAGGFRFRANGGGNEFHVLAEQFGKAGGNGLQGKSGIGFVFGTAQMRGKDKACALIQQELDGGESSHNAGVIGNFPILERDVEIHAHEDFLSLGVKVANSKFSHIGLYCLVQ